MEWTSQRLRKRKTHLVTALLVISFLVMPIAGLQRSSQHISSYGMVNYSPFMGKGVNYLSRYHMYSSNYTTDDILRRDFSRFEEDGINVISLSLYWYRLEGNIRGSYDGEYLPYPEEIGGPYGDRFLDEVKRVCRIASEYGLKVLLSIHTLWSETDSAWCTPDYVLDPVTGENMGLAIVRSEDMKQAFLDMFTYVVQYMADDTPFYGWTILSEPWYWPLKLDPPFDYIDQKENFIDLMLKQRDIVETFDAKRKTSIKFCSSHIWIGTDEKWRVKNIFEECWHWDERILQVVDFAGFDTYFGESGGDQEAPTDNMELVSQWKSIHERNFLWCSERGKEVWITEMGYPSDDDEFQLAKIKWLMDYFRTLPIKAVLGWCWWSDETDPDAAHGYPGKGFNLCKDVDGNPRPAYYELISFGH